MATIKQKKALKNITENGGNISRAMREAGYSEQTSKTPKNLTESKGFKELLTSIKEEPLLDRLRNIGLEGSERNSIEAIKELLKLKNRYPDKSLKLGKLDEEINDLFE